MIILNFLGSMGFSIVLPSLWPFIKSVRGAQLSSANYLSLVAPRF